MYGEWGLSLQTQLGLQNFLKIFTITPYDMNKMPSGATKILMLSVIVKIISDIPIIKLTLIPPGRNKCQFSQNKIMKSVYEPRR
ncbi:MAG: hypothetical protein SVZ03_15935, partial [Spirochaetota bacterium]|nr:hypothetical protein [Spirochaetota bacterium]